MRKWGVRGNTETLPSRPEGFDVTAWPRGDGCPPYVFVEGINVSDPTFTPAAAEKLAAALIAAARYARTGR